MLFLRNHSLKKWLVFYHTSGLAIGLIWGIYAAFVYLTEFIPIAGHPLRHVSTIVLHNWAFASMLFDVGMIIVASHDSGVGDRNARRDVFDSCEINSF